MKVIKFITVLIAVVVLLSNSFSVLAVDFTTDYFDIEENLYFNSNDASVSLMADIEYTYTASNDFGISEAMLSSDQFLYLDDLPYGKDSLIIAGRVPTVTYFFVLNSKVDNIIGYENASNGRVRIALYSKDTIYRYAFIIDSGSFASFSGSKGLTECANQLSSGSDDLFEQALISDGYKTGYGYTFPAFDCLCTVSPNNSNLTYMFTSIPYGIDTYPTRESVSLDTEKGILSTLKTIPDKIGDFFEDLKNYLLYFQADEPEHVDPFEGILTDVQSFFESRMNGTSDFKDSLNSTFDNVSSYINTGSSVINKLLQGVPLLNAFLIFFLVVAVVRKVVGR